MPKLRALLAILCLLMAAGPALARDHEVIVADSRGQGRSTHGLAGLTYHRMAEDYVALLARLGVGKVTSAPTPSGAGPQTAGLPSQGIVR